jgi:hypothetical protein
MTLVMNITRSGNFEKSKSTIRISNFFPVTFALFALNFFFSHEAGRPGSTTKRARRFRCQQVSLASLQTKISSP